MVSQIGSSECYCIVFSARGQKTNVFVSLFIRKGCLVEKSERSQRIAKLNDQFRQSVGLLTPKEPAVPGMAVMTAGIDALSPLQKFDILQRVREFDTFTEDNDPWGEHDFGIIVVEGVGSVYWKVDYYEPSLTYGSEDPSDPTITMRVLTIMLASEY